MKIKILFFLSIVGFMITPNRSLFANTPNPEFKRNQSSEVTIFGVVSDTQGDPLGGITVQITNNPNKTITTPNGNYCLKANIGDTIEFSHLGYISQIKRVSKTDTINIVLQGKYDSLKNVTIKDHVNYNFTPETDIVKILSEAQKKNIINVYGHNFFIIDNSSELYESKNVALDSRIVSSHNVGFASPISYEYSNSNTEEYATYKENKFISPLSEALSTFSIDVDGASYSNFRRMINNGQKPNEDAIRIEEFVNYFSYNYDQPTQKDPIKITTEVGQCPWATDHRLLRIGLKAKEIASDNLPASNFVFLIDVSGSMEGATRLDLVKASMKLLTNNLRDKDRVAIVTYSGNAGLALPSTPGSNKQAIEEALDNMTAGGSTAGGKGIQLAYKIAQENFVKGGNNRIILCTDGDFNVGVSSNEGLENLIEKKRKSGVFLSVLGYGMGNYKDDRMQVLAEKGNGNAAYIDNLQEANRVLVEQFGGTLFTVAKDVKLQVEFNPAQVQAYRLVGYESRLLNKEDFNDDTKDAGEIGAGHTVTALYEIVPQGVDFTQGGAVDDLKYQTTKVEKKTTLNKSPELCTIKLRYKQPDSDKSVKMELPVVDNRKNDVSSDMKFASAVAMFAQLLKNSDYKGTATYDSVISLAKQGLDNDPNGYRREFIRLVETTKGLK